MFIRLSFIIWVVFLVLSLYFCSILQSLVNLFLLHYVILRAIPWYVFGLKPYGICDLSMRILECIPAGDKRYIWYRIKLEKGFNKTNYRNWIAEKIVMNRDINVTLTYFGPETLMLYYLKPLQFNVNHHKVVHSMEGDQANVKYIHELINNTGAGENAPAMRTWFFPSSADQECSEIVFAFLHDIVDGEGAVSFIRQICDEALPPVSTLQRLTHDIKYVCKHVTSITALGTTINNLASWRDQPHALMTLENFTREAYPSHLFHSLPTLDMSRIQSAGRKHGFTINDVIQAALVSGWTKLHKKRGFELKYFGASFARNLRDYDQPFRVMNETGHAEITLSCGPVAMKTIKDISDYMYSIKKDYKIVYATNIIQFMSAYIINFDHMVQYCIENIRAFRWLLSNLRGPEKPLYIQGYKVESFNTSGLSGLGLIYMMSYAGQLSIVANSAPNFFVDDFYEYMKEFEQAIEEYAELLNNN